MSDFLNKYPYTDFHELNLDWVIERVKKLTEDWAATLEEWNSTEEQWQQLYDYVHDYFDNLDVQQEINNKINAMIADGTFVTITTPVIEAKVASMMPSTVAAQIGGTVASQIGGTVAGQLPGVVSDQIGAAIVSPVNDWLNDHITQPTTPVVDTSLSIPGAAADAAATGEVIGYLRYDLDNVAKSNIMYRATSDVVSGTSAWNGDYINLSFTPVPGKYYLRIDSVTNCLTNVCAVLKSFVNGVQFSMVEMEVSDVTNHVVKSLDVGSNITSMQLVLYRNYSASTTAAGDTTFGYVQITFDNENVIYFADADLNLSENNQFKEVMMNRFSENIHTINTANIGADIYSINWLTDNYFLFFNRDVYLNTLDPLFDTSSESVTYKIMQANTDTIQNGSTLTLIDTITGTTNTPTVFNRILRKNQIINITCYNAHMYECETKYIRGCYDFAPRIGYNNSGTASQIDYNQWESVRGCGEFKVYETTDFVHEYNNFWMDKRIVWFGTSIPEGGYLGDRRSSYPKMTGKLLGAAVYNEAIGSSSISRRVPSAITTANPYGFDTTDFNFAKRALCDDLTVKEWLISNYDQGFFTDNVPATITPTEANLIRSYSYENKVDRYLPGGDVGNVDLYVFDHGYNDDMYRDTEQLETDYGIDTIYCFDGGMNFLIRRILAANPDAKIVIITHYTDDAICGNNTAEFVKKVCEAQKAVSDRWNIKYVNIFEQLEWSGQLIPTTGYWDPVTNIWINTGGSSRQLQIKDMHVRDTTHPYTDASGKSNTAIAEIIAAELKNIVR